MFLNCRGTRAWSKGQGLGPCDADLRAFESLPLHSPITLFDTMKIIAFTGMPYSGKSEAVQIAKENNIPIIRMGDLVWEETQKQGLPLTDTNVGTIADTMRKQHGKDIWAQRTIKKIKSLKQTNYLIIDGIRNIEEINLFRKQLSQQFMVIAIDARDDLRQTRAFSRGRTDDIQSIKEFEERDKRELSWGLGEVIASADIVITNDGTLTDFQKKITNLLDRLQQTIT